MAFLILLTFLAGAIVSLGVARATDRHRRWTLAMIERRRRRVADALGALERDLWDATGDSPPTPDARARFATPARDEPPRRVELRVKP